MQGNNIDSQAGGKPALPPEKKGAGLAVAALVALAMSLVTSLGAVAIYHQRYAQKIVTMDLKEYIREQRDKAVSGEITDEQLRNNIDALEAALLAAPPNHVVLLKEVVLRNAGEIKP